MYLRIRRRSCSSSYAQSGGEQNQCTVRGYPEKDARESLRMSPRRWKSRADELKIAQKSLNKPEKSLFRICVQRTLTALRCVKFLGPLFRSVRRFPFLCFISHVFSAGEEVTAIDRAADGPRTDTRLSSSSPALAWVI